MKYVKQLGEKKGYPFHMVVAIFFYYEKAQAWFGDICEFLENWSVNQIITTMKLTIGKIDKDTGVCSLYRRIKRDFGAKNMWWNIYMGGWIICGT